MALESHTRLFWWCR